MKSKYPKIAHFGEAITEIFKDGEVTIEEKIDGSQFRIYVDNNTIQCGSKEVNWDEEHPIDQMFVLANEEAMKIFKDVPLRDTMVFCEYVKKEKHNTMKYGRVPKHNLIVFDVCMDGVFLDYHAKKKFAETMDLEVVPLLWKGNGLMIDMELINNLLQVESILGKEKIEGVVFKNHSKIWSSGHQIGKPIILKYVREDFKERNKVEWRTSTQKGFIEVLIESMRTEARWNKAVNHLRDNGLLTQSPKDIGELMKELNKDIELEEKETIKEELWKHFNREIRVGVTRGFPEWYKAKLIETALVKGESL